MVLRLPFSKASSDESESITGESDEAKDVFCWVVLYATNFTWRIIPVRIMASPIPAEMIQFDKHTFEMGWFNHQLDIDLSWSVDIYLEDHPRTCKCLGPPPFVSHFVDHLEGEQPSYLGDLDNHHAY